MGGHPLRGAPPGSAAAVAADCTGYVQHVDLAALQRLAEDAGRDLFLAVLPGSFVHPAAPLAHAAGLDDDQAARLRAAFSVGRTRTYDQDPRFGLIALAETASRALSPAVNDPGTAIEVTGRLVRVLLCWREAAAAEVLWPRLHVPPIRAQDLMQDAFRPIARDGAALVEVQVRLLKALKALAAAAPDVFAVVAADQTAEILARADKAGLLPRECAQLAALGQEVATLAEGHWRPGGM
jgi:uncharacterized membrane protein